MGESEHEGHRQSEEVAQREVQQSTSLASPQIFEVIRHEGMEELNRPRGSLAWSGVAAGIALSLSVYCQAFLLSLDGEMPWARSLFGGILPTLLGNIIGGTGLFPLTTYAQVRDEVKPE